MQSIIKFVSFSLCCKQKEMDLDAVLEILALDESALSSDEVCVMLLKEQMDSENKCRQFKKYTHFHMEKFGGEESTFVLTNKGSENCLLHYKSSMPIPLEKVT